MTDEHYRAINRAISMLDNDTARYAKMAHVDVQDVREAARTALHHIFGRENRLREVVADYERGEEPLARQLQDENDRLREELQQQAEGFKENLRKGTEEVRAQRDDLRAALTAIANPPVIFAEDDATEVAGWFVSEARAALVEDKGLA